VLVARRQDRLDALAAELKKRYGTICTVAPLDLSQADAAASLAATLAKKKINVSSLINNAGFGNHGLLVTVDPSQLNSGVGVNVAAVVALIRAFLPQLLENGNGALVNVASTAGFQPIPRMAVYAATKAFVLSFAQAIWYEAKGSGLRALDRSTTRPVTVSGRMNAIQAKLIAFAPRRVGVDLGGRLGAPGVK